MPGQLADAFISRRQLMVETQLRARGIRDERVLAAMLAVPRHEFVPAAKRNQAYDDQPVEIEAGQTTSQPYIIGAMLQGMRLKGEERVLEIGAGSGYVTALLSQLAATVFAVERHALLAEAARERLERLGYAAKVNLVVADGSRGLPEEAPFGAILVSAAAPAVPQPLAQQLADGGRMVIPVGGLDSQVLLLVEKRGQENVKSELDNCRFVPLIGSQGFPE